MSTQWSPESLFAYTFSDMNGKRTIQCQMHDPSSNTQCMSNVPDHNVPELHILTIALAARPIDHISEAAIEDLARLSVCEHHLNSPGPVANRWKALLVDEIKARWRESRHKMRELQKMNHVLADELDARKQKLEIAEGKAKALQVDLTVAEGKQTAMRSEVKILEGELEGNSWGVVGKLFGGIGTGKSDESQVV